MLDRKPEISVVMPVYNGACYIREAIKSVLAQTFGNFELIVSDDGSTDGSAEIAEAISDPRIVVARSSVNAGISAALNEGFRLARGEFIARMDCDDISHKQRFELQRNFLLRHRDVGVCGSWLQIFGDCSTTIWRYPPDDSNIRCLLLFHSSMPHAASCFRRQVIEHQNPIYRSEFNGAEDYDLWTRIAPTARFANLSRVLYHYRRTNTPQQQQSRQCALHATSRIRQSILHRLGLALTEAEFSLFSKICDNQFEPRIEFLEAAQILLERIKERNSVMGVFPEPSFCRVLATRLLAVCAEHRTLARIAKPVYFGSSLARFRPANLRKLVRLWWS